MEKESVIISEGERPIWQIVIAAVFYTLCLFFLFKFLYTIKFNLENELIKRTTSLFEVSLYCFVFGIGFSNKNTKFFNLESKKYKNQYSVGPIKVGKWKNLPAIEYVSVFKNGSDIFEINIWHNRNKHFNIYNYTNKNEAVEMSFFIAEQLNIKLFDATVANNFKYLDMDELRQKYK